MAGDVMLLQAICECVKQIHKRAPKLLSFRPEIPWFHVMSMRDRIAHGYFDIDIDFVNEIITNDLNPLLAAIDAFLNVMLNVMLLSPTCRHQFSLSGSFEQVG